MIAKNVFDHLESNVQSYVRAFPSALDRVRGAELRDVNYRAYSRAYIILYLALASLLFISYDYELVGRLAEIKWLPEALLAISFLLMSGVLFLGESIHRPKKYQWLAGGIALYLLASYYIVFVLDLKTVYLLTREDNFFEWLGAAFFLGTSIAFFFYAWNDKTKTTVSLSRRINLFGLLLAIMFFFGFGEEISWGQRVLGVDTPGELERLNWQGELNLHNLRIPQLGTDGEIVRVWKIKSIVHHLFDQFWFGFCVLLPVLNALSSRLSGLLRRIRFPVSPLWIGIFFVANYSIPVILILSTPSEIHHGIKEIREANFALLFLIVSILLAVNAVTPRRP